ncbi:hypothetical protein I6F26_28075 [Ensifer sp. IC3342]|nr:hypothetical protein [Ensifer sp. BRP08]MCA1450409.1 hypothetical protein [Ensifer sp. IC3342]
MDDRPVKPDRVRKSVGAEDTFQKDIHRLDEAIAGLAPLIEKVWRYCEASSIRGRTVTVKIKYADFRQATRSRSTHLPIDSIGEVEDICEAILASEFPVEKGVRLLGVTLSSLVRTEDNGAVQISFDL